MKKFIIGLMAFALVFSFAFTVTPVDAEEGLDEILALLCPMFADAGLDYPGCDGETTETTETPSQVDSRIPAGFSFDQNLKQGMSGENVMYLQILLNADADTMLAASGAGSPGNETLYFGPITTAAVKKFQTKYASEVLSPIGLTMATGYVGAQTRTKLNALLAGGVTGTTPTTGDSAILTQLQAIMAAIAALEARIDEIDTGVGTEGTLESAVRADISNVDVYAEETAEVAKFRLTAKDSDMTVQRVDVTFDKTVAQMRSGFDSMALWVDGEKVAETTIDRDTLATGATWIRFSGLDISIPKEGYKDIVVQATASTSTTSLGAVTLTLTTGSAVRAVDGAGLTKYNTSTVSRAFDRLGSVTGVLEIKRTSGSPEAQAVLVDPTTMTEVELLEFTLEAKDSNLDMNEIKVTVSDSGNGFVTNKIDDLMLLVGDSTYYAVNSGDTFTFDVSDSVLNAGVKETYKVVAKALDTVSGTNNHWYTGTQLYASVVAGDADGYDSTDTLRATTSTITGNTQHLYTVAPQFTLVSGTASQIDSSSPKNIAIEFEVMAHGGDIWIATGDGLATVSTTTGLYRLAGFTSATGTTAVTRLGSGGTLDTTTTKAAYDGSTVATWYKITEGNTARFDVVSGDTNLAAAGKAYLSRIVWFFDNEVSGATPIAVPWTGDFVEYLETNRL